MNNLLPFFKKKRERQVSIYTLILFLVDVLSLNISSTSKQYSYFRHDGFGKRGIIFL